ncbi:hypothetical protein CROQUDRAFT_723060 [Cronartium quercuum f. sp. fusiforme G11]|uniref:Uncharacterized protein n=1 Tax=Cronartium quercuum f. sp. fusiforme G11 TaxID=708437 RepID=A0A9P6TC07_9BASI|nr:hypothetical protein CROQUDRAFT_723060 [Cronartium quercuum f. sp. fusiforme G11]
MITSNYQEYLATYLPTQLITLISFLNFTFQKLVLPKLEEIYSNASLDPNTLLPFIFSAIILYLSLISIYHTFKASAKLIWFGIKWSVLITLIWFLLGTFNEINQNFKDVNHHHHHHHQFIKNPSQSWLKSSNWKKSSKEFKSSKFLNPIKSLINQVIEPNHQFLNSFFSSSSSSSSSRVQPIKQTKFENIIHSKNSSPPPKDINQSVNVKIWNFLIQNVHEPMIKMIRESKLKSNQREKEDSKTYNR